MDLTRRALVTGAAGTAIAGQLRRARADNADLWFTHYQKDNGFHYRATRFDVIDEGLRRQMVQYYSSEPPGTLVVDTGHRFIYLIAPGVASGRLWAKGYGRDRIVRNGPEARCTSQNRRVVTNLRGEFDAAAPQAQF